MGPPKGDDAMDTKHTQLDRRDFIRTLAVVGAAASALALEPTAAEAASCPKFPKPKTSKEVVPIGLQSESGAVIDGQMDLRTVKQSSGGGAPAVLSVELFFDTFEERTSVRSVTDTVAALTLVDSNKHRPPLVMFAWGKGLSFKCTFESCNVGFTLFLDDGTPVRAIALVQLQLLDDCTPVV